MKFTTTTCWHCQTEHTAAHYDRIVYNKTQLYGPWAGWRMAGRDLVSPDGDRINPRRLAGILWSENLRARIRSVPNTAAIVRDLAIIIPARERFAGSA